MQCFTKLKTFEVGIIERAGRYKATVFANEKKFLIPFLDKLFIYERIPREKKFSDITIKLDKNKKIILEAIIKYKILEPFKARYSVIDKNLDLTLKNYISQSLKQILQAQNGLSENDFKILFYKKVEKVSKEWGFKLIDAEIKPVESLNA